MRAWYEGELVCDDVYIEECIDNEWIEIEDCYYECFGTCRYFNNIDPVCVCGWPEPWLTK